MSTSNYVTVTNNAILESGADLATFQTNGADWTSNTNTLMQRIQRYVARAWKEIQQEAFDWNFLAEQAVVNIDPGVMFYTDGTSVSIFSGAYTGTTLDILDQDGSVAINDMAVTSFFDLTGISTDVLPFGYFNLNSSGGTQLTYQLKPGAEYFSVNAGTVHFDSSVDFSPNSNDTTSYTNNLNSYDITLPTLATLDINGFTYSVGLVNFTAADSGLGYILYDWEVACSSADATAIMSHAISGGTMTFTDPNNSSRIYLSITSDDLNADFNGSAHDITGAIHKAFIHGWKSFNFSEETGKDDFQEDIKEVDQKSFRVIDYYKAPATGEVPISYIPWEDFQRLYDISSAPPGIPRIITRDNTNRFRLYPHPYYKMTLKFGYTRVPQQVVNYDDTFQKLDEDFIDIIMWRALMMYGEFDEQPSVSARATKNYKNILSRLEQQYRQKFHFKPARLF